MRGDQLARQWQLIQLLARSRAGVGIDRLLDGLECTRRTLYRDLDALRYAGFPVIDEKRDGRVFYKFIDNYGLGDAPFTPDEVVALALSEDLLSVLEGTLFYDSVQSALSKIRSNLGPEVTEYLNSLRDSLRVIPEPHKNYSESRETVRVMHEAVLRQRRVALHYRSASSGGKESQRDFDPYRVWYRSGGLYTVGLDHQSGELRTFAIERIISIELLEASFEIREDFDFDAFVASAFGVISDEAMPLRIQFSPKVAPYVEERTWHPSQQLEKTDDGHLLLFMEVGSTAEVRNWILSFGSNALVLEPDSLREEIARELKAACANYNVKDGAKDRAKENKVPS